jgi:hypothetical protein
VFQIRDILRQIQIQILGSVQWITDPDLALFVHSFQDPIKMLVFYVFFCFLLSAGTFTSVFKDNTLLRSHKTLEIKSFHNFMLVDGKIWIQIRIRICTNKYGSGFGSWNTVQKIVQDVYFAIYLETERDSLSDPVCV